MKHWYFPLHRVEQHDDHGCAIACVATICGLTYERARHEFFPFKRRFKDNLSLTQHGNQIASVIKSLGFTCMFSDVYKGHELPAIMFFDWQKGGGTHAVVWDPFRGVVLDPGYDSPMSQQFYASKWRIERYDSIIVTGRKK